MKLVKLTALVHMTEPAKDVAVKKSNYSHAKRGRKQKKNHAPQIKKAAWTKLSKKSNFFLSITHKWPFDKGLEKTNQKQNNRVCRHF